MTEEGLLSLEKKKKKKHKRHLEEVPECPERSNEEMQSHKTHKKKKKKSKETEKDDHRPAETQGEQHKDKVQKKTKRKREAENVNVSATVVKEEDADTGVSQDEEVKKKKKKKKKRSDEETASAGENTQAEVTFTQVHMDSEVAPQEPAKKKSKKASKNAKVLGKEIEEEEEEGEEIVDDAVRAEILEFYPNYNFTPDVLKKTIRYDLPRLRKFKDQGIPVRSGRFTASENKRLKQNVKNFLALSGIKNELQLLWPQRFPAECASILRLRKQFSFLTHLCEGIPRSWRTIIGRARKSCDEENYKGRFSEEENNTLMKLHTLHGANWAHISKLMGRSRASVQKRFSMIATNHGTWSEEEFKRLLGYVRQQLMERVKPAKDGSLIIKKMDLYKNLGWTAVSEQMGCRSWFQCRIKWMEYLTSKMKVGGRIKGRKNLESVIQLIKLVNEMVVEDSSDIVWDDLTHLFGNTPPDYLQIKFHHLKHAYVPGWRTMPFCDVIDFLYEKTLPKLEKELEVCKEKEEPTETRNYYKLSEIFPDLA